jgi:hypothetical protein
LDCRSKIVKLGNSSKQEKKARNLKKKQEISEIQTKNVGNPNKKDANPNKK